MANGRLGIRLYRIIVVHLVLWLAMCGSVFAPLKAAKTTAVIGLVFAILSHHAAYNVVRRGKDDGHEPMAGSR